METMIQVNDTTRIYCGQDIDAEDPRHYFENTEIHIFNSSGGSYNDIQESDDSVATYFNAIYEYYGEDIALRALNILRGFDVDIPNIVETRTVRGYSQGDWADILILSDSDEEFDYAVTSFNDWMWGDVSYLRIEKLASCGHWESMEDSYVGGIVAKNDEDFISIAKDYGLID